MGHVCLYPLRPPHRLRWAYPPGGLQTHLPVEPTRAGLPPWLATGVSRRVPALPLWDRVRAGPHTTG